MNGTATSTMSFSRADIRWTPMATRSISITELRIARLPWLGPACDLCSTGWTPMEVASGASERRTCEIALRRLPVCFWVPSPSPKSRVYDQTPNLSGLLRLWTGIRVTRRSGRTSCVRGRRSNELNYAPANRLSITSASLPRPWIFFPCPSGARDSI